MIMLADTSWFSGMSTFEKVYWWIAIPFTILFLIQLVLTFLGGEIDHDGLDHDFEDVSDGGGFHVLTVKNMIAFFSIFSWSGIACINAGLGWPLTVVVSVVSGTAMMFVMAGLYYLMTRMTQSGTIKMTDAIGLVGTVYLTIPARKEGQGKVQIKVQGPLRTLDAMTEDLEDIKTGSTVRVLEIISDSILLVERAR